MTAELLLEAHGLDVTRRSSDGTAHVLAGADLIVSAGEVVDVGGPSGVGKSTLLLALARLLPGATGRLALRGVSSSEIEPRSWRRDVLYVPQTPYASSGTIREALLLPWHLHVRSDAVLPDADRMRSALDSLGLSKLSLDREPGRLSVGQAARLALARALLVEPAVLLLDEPDANLDDDAARLAYGATREFAQRGHAVVRVRHRRGADGADRRLLLADGILTEVTDAS